MTDLATNVLYYGDNLDILRRYLPRNLLNQAFGKGFVAASVEIAFSNLGDQTICRVTVKPAPGPVFLKTLGKDGQSSERFYVRSGNSSQEIPAAQLKEYWDQRFV